MLLSLEEIRERLLAQYEALDFSLPELEMKRSSTDDATIAKLEAELGCKLTGSFRSLIQDYDFGQLSFGGVFFGQTGDYVRFLRTANSPENSPVWWGGGTRPSDHVRVAGTDGHVIILQAETEEILGYLRSEHWTSNKRLATNFELFVRGAGTVHFGRRETRDRRLLGQSIAAECNGEIGFWTELALGVT